MPSLWKGQAQSIFLSRFNEFVVINNANIVKSLLRIADYIKNIKVLDDKIDNPHIARFVQAA